MAEDSNSAATNQGNTEQAGPQFSLERIYLKDLSFEAPLGIDGLTKKWTPTVNQEVATKTNKLADDRYEVILTVTASIQDKEKEVTIYLVEVQQAGVFQVSGVNQEQLAQLLNTQCPNLLFPYVREVVDNVAVKGGFPALNLPPINFDAMFYHAMQQAKAKAEANQQGEAAETH